jgi:hypothetical protein
VSILVKQVVSAICAVRPAFGGCYSIVVSEAAESPRRMERTTDILPTPGETKMRRIFAITILSVTLASTPGSADDLCYVPTPIAVSPSAAYYSAPVIYPAPVIRTPVYYAAPVVAYQPAYVVPTSTVVVAGYPGSAVVVGQQVYAPMVATSFYAPVSVYRPAGHFRSAYYAGPVALGPRAVNIKYRRRWHGGYKMRIRVD